MANELWFKGKQYSGVGKSTEGVSYTIDDQTYTGGAGAEIFNDYTGNKAIGVNSHAEGCVTTAIGLYSHAEGCVTIAQGNNSHTEGDATVANGSNSHAEGSSTTAHKANSHAEGELTNAIGIGSHSEGYNSQASGAYAHAEGWGTTASGDYAHAEGLSNSATASGAHAEGYNNTASGNYSHVEGINNEATKQEAHAEGYQTKATGDYAHSEGAYTIASGQASHAEGYEAEAQGKHSHAEGYHTVAKDYGHAENYRTEASFEAHAEGYTTKAIGDYSHAEGGETISKGTGSHAEGLRTKALSTASHAEGQSSATSNMITLTSTETEKVYSFSLLSSTNLEYGDIICNKTNNEVIAIIVGINNNKVTLNNNLGTLSEVQYILYQSGAAGANSHTEGEDCKAVGHDSHAEGYKTVASGMYSHTAGQGTIAKGENQCVIGKYNIPDDNNTYAFIIGNGQSASNRWNALAIGWDGKICEPTGGSILVSQNSSISMNAASKIETTNGFNLNGTNGGEITLGKGASNKSIYLNAEGNTLALNSNTNVNLSAASITMATGGNITMNNGGALSITQGSNLSMTNGGNLKIKQGSLLKVGDVGNPDPDGDGDILIKGYHYYQIPGMEEGGSEAGESSILLSDSSIVLKSYDRYAATTTDALDPQYSLLSLADNAKITINQLEDTQNSPKFNCALSQIKAVDTGNDDTVDVGTNVEISSERLSIKNTVKQALQYNQGRGVLTNYNINFGDSISISNYKLNYDDNDEYATTNEALQHIFLEDTIDIIIKGSDNITSDDGIINITRPAITMEDPIIEINNAHLNVDTCNVSFKKVPDVQNEGQFTFSAGSNTVSFTITELQALKALISNT